MHLQYEYEYGYEYEKEYEKWVHRGYTAEAGKGICLKGALLTYVRAPKTNQHEQ